MSDAKNPFIFTDSNGEKFRLISPKTTTSAKSESSIEDINIYVIDSSGSMGDATRLIVERILMYQKKYPDNKFILILFSYHCLVYELTYNTYNKDKIIYVKRGCTLITDTLKYLHEYFLSNPKKIVTLVMVSDGVMDDWKNGPYEESSKLLMNLKYPNLSYIFSICFGEEANTEFLVEIAKNTKAGLSNFFEIKHIDIKFTEILDKLDDIHLFTFNKPVYLLPGGEEIEFMTNKVGSIFMAALDDNLEHKSSGDITDLLKFLEQVHNIIRTYKSTNKPFSSDTITHVLDQLTLMIDTEKIDYKKYIQYKMRKLKNDGERKQNDTPLKYVKYLLNDIRKILNNKSIMTFSNNEARLSYLAPLTGSALKRVYKTVKKAEEKKEKSDKKEETTILQKIQNLKQISTEKYKHMNDDEKSELGECLFSMSSLYESLESSDYLNGIPDDISIEKLIKLIGIPGHAIRVYGNKADQWSQRIKLYPVIIGSNITHIQKTKKLVVPAFGNKKFNGVLISGPEYKMLKGTGLVKIYDALTLREDLIPLPGDHQALLTLAIMDLLTKNQEWANTLAVKLIGELSKPYFEQNKKYEKPLVYSDISYKIGEILALSSNACDDDVSKDFQFLLTLHAYFRLKNSKKSFIQLLLDVADLYIFNTEPFSENVEDKEQPDTFNKEDLKSKLAGIKLDVFTDDDMNLFRAIAKHLNLYIDFDVMCHNSIIYAILSPTWYELQANIKKHHYTIVGEFIHLNNKKIVNSLQLDKSWIERNIIDGMQEEEMIIADLRDYINLANGLGFVSGIDTNNERVPSNKLLPSHILFKKLLERTTDPEKLLLLSTGRLSADQPIQMVNGICTRLNSYLTGILNILGYLDEYNKILSIHGRTHNYRLNRENRHFHGNAKPSFHYDDIKTEKLMPNPKPNNKILYEKMLGSSIKEFFRTHTLAEIIEYGSIHINCCGFRNGVPVINFPTSDGYNLDYTSKKIRLRANR